MVAFAAAKYATRFFDVCGSWLARGMMHPLPGENAGRYLC